MTAFELAAPKPLEVDPDQEGWMVSYADMITLLFIFFALMLSISVVSKAKFDLLTSQFNRASTTSLVELKKRLDSEIASQNLAAQVETRIGDEGLQIQFSERVLFPSGEAALNSSGVGVMGRFATLLKGLESQFRLAVEGHTDSRPISTREFPSNWALSSARSVNVLHFLASRGVDERRMVVRAYADTRPLAPAAAPADEASLARSRRVTLLVH